MEIYNYNSSTEYEKAMRFLKTGCNRGCAKMIDLREAFQGLSRCEQDIFLMAQLKAMNGGEITASRRLKNKLCTNKRTFTIRITTRHFVKKLISIC